VAGFDLTGLGGVTDVLGKLIDLFPNPKDKQEALQKLQEFDTQLALGQQKINEAEAKSDNLFVAGWRPFIGWVCGFGFVYSIIQPALHLPPVDMNNVVAILGGLLGLGTMRTVEKVKGVR
jgi:hypothetical protein